MPLHAITHDDGEQLYVRPLPSGGYVAIEAKEVTPLFAPPRLRGEVVVERRGEARRAGHLPPLAAVAERETIKDIIAALLPIAEDDQLIAELFRRGVTVPVTRRHQS